MTAAIPAATLQAAAPGALRIAVVGTAFSLLWSSAFVAGKIGLAVAAPLTLLALRFLLAGALLYLGLRLAGRRVAPVSRQALAAGLLTNASYLGLVYLGMASMPAALTAILVCTAPLTTAALAAAWLREPLTARRVAGLALAFGAVIAIMGRRLHFDGIAPLPVAFICTGSLALAVGTLVNRRVAGRDDPWDVAVTQLLGGGFALLPLAIWIERLRFEPGTAFYGSLLYQAGPVSIGATLMMLWLIRHGGAGRASAFHLLNPFFSIALAAVLLGERVDLLDLAGLLPLVAGMALALRR